MGGYTARMKPLRIVFMGTPRFAVPSLQALIDSPHQIVAVYSQPPRPAGRGYKLVASPVQQLAEQQSIPVHCPVSLKKQPEQEAFAALKPDVAVVVAYGLLLPQAILAAPRLGCLNVHPSRLPRWRGAAPLQRQIMAGDTETSLCIMQMDAGLDTGDVLMQRDFPLEDATTAGALHDFMAQQAGPMLLETLSALDDGSAKPSVQAAEGVTYAGKISKDEAAVDFSLPARQVLRHIHGLSPFPGATCQLNGESLKLLEVRLVKNTSGAPGAVLDDGLTIACGEGAIQVLLAQRAGKKPMLADELLRGFPVLTGSVAR